MGTTKLEIDENIIKNQLLFKDDQNDFNLVLPSSSSETPSATIIKPQPGICVKTKDASKNSKVFINVCVSEGIPAPEDITDDQLLAIFESDYPSDFRVPMSIGQLHEENDKGGNKCSAYDIAIHPSFLTKIKNNPLFSTFFMVVTIEGIEQKYGLTLDKNCWSVLKNKKYHGTLPENHRVRTTVPLVQELSGIKHWKPSDFDTSSKKYLKTSSKEDLNFVRQEGSNKCKNSVISSPMMTEIETKRVNGQKNSNFEDSGAVFKKRKPHFSFEKNMATPPFESSFLKIEVDLPEVISYEELKVEIGGNCLIVESERYFLSEVFPYDFVTTGTKAFFVKSQRVLVILVPLEEKI